MNKCLFPIYDILYDIYTINKIASLFEIFDFSKVLSRKYNVSDIANSLSDIFNNVHVRQESFLVFFYAYAKYFQKKKTVGRGK